MNTTGIIALAGIAFCAFARTNAQETTINPTASLALVQTFIPDYTTEAAYDAPFRLSGSTVLYLSTTGPFGNGSSPSAPLDASTQPKLDAIWAAWLPKGNVCFIYAPGLYQTKGWFFNSRETIYTGNCHIGAGIDKTILQLVGASNRTADGVIFARDMPATVSNWCVSDMTLDSNAVNQPKWTGAGGAAGAINLVACQNVAVQRVKFINFGTPTVGCEVFPLNAFAQSSQFNVPMQNILFDSCIFTQPAAGNKDGCSCCTIADDSNIGCYADNSCVISNCQFINCFNSAKGQPGDFSYQHCYGGPTCIGNYSIGCQYLYFIEPDNQTSYSQDTIQVQDNIGINCSRGLYILLHGNSGINNLAVNNEMYVLNNGGVGFWMTGEGSAVPPGFGNNITIQNCTLLTSGSSTYGFVFDEHGTNDMQIKSLTIEGNVLEGFAAGQNFLLDPSSFVLPQQTILNNTEAFQLSGRVHEPILAYNADVGGASPSVALHLDTVWQ